MRNYEALSLKEQLPLRQRDAVIDLSLGFVSTLYLFNILVNPDIIEPSAELDTTTALTTWTRNRLGGALWSLLFVILYIALITFARCMMVVLIPFALPAIAIVGKLSKICRYVGDLFFQRCNGGHLTGPRVRQQGRRVAHYGCAALCGLHDAFIGPPC